LQVVGAQESDDDSENEFDHDNNNEDVEWDFDTIKGKPGAPRSIPLSDKHANGEKDGGSGGVTPISGSAPTSTGVPAPKLNDRIGALQDESRSRSMSDPPKQSSPSVGKKGGQPSSSIQGVAAPAPATPAAAPAPSSAPPPATNGTQQPAQQRPSALTQVIYPVLSKLLKSNQEEGVIAALAQLKIAFDNAERAKPGITHSMIAQIIETLKR